MQNIPIGTRSMASYGVHHSIEMYLLVILYLHLSFSSCCSLLSLQYYPSCNHITVANYKSSLLLARDASVSRVSSGFNGSLLWAPNKQFTWNFHSFDDADSCTYTGPRDGEKALEMLINTNAYSSYVNRFMNTLPRSDQSIVVYYIWYNVG